MSRSRIAILAFGVVLLIIGVLGYVGYLGW